MSDSLYHWNIGRYVPDASFSFTAAVNTVSFSSESGPSMTHSWTFGDGGISSQASPVHQFTASGTYTVQHKVIDNCKQHKQQQVVQVLFPTYLKDHLKEGVSVSPNPFSNQLNLKIPSGLKQVKIRIVDLYGSTLGLYENSELIDTDQYPAGFYILRVETESGIYTQRICKHEL